MDVTFLKQAKTGLAVIAIVGGFLMTLGTMVYKVNTIDSLAVDVHAQSQRIIVIEERTRTLETLRTEDLALLRQDLRDLRVAIDRIDKKIDTLRR